VGRLEPRGLNAKRDQMSAAELQELDEVKVLIARGLEVGVLTYAEVATATAELGLEDTARGDVLDPDGSGRGQPAWLRDHQ
jgi:hypothetical protein